MLFKSFVIHRPLLSYSDAFTNMLVDDLLLHYKTKLDLVAKGLSLCMMVISEMTLLFIFIYLFLAALGLPLLRAGFL